MARLREVDLDLGQDPSGIRRKHEDPVAHQDGFLDIVGDHQDRGDRHSSFAPEVEQVGAQCFRRQHVERRERLVHQQHFWMHDERTGKSHPLTHAAGELLRVGAFVAVQTDQIDGGEGPLVALLRRDPLRLEPDLDILEHREPGKQREGLKHHRDLGGGAIHPFAADRHRS